VGGSRPEHELVMVSDIHACNMSGSCSRPGVTLCRCILFKTHNTLLPHVTSVAILAQMIVPQRMHDLRMYGLKPWDDDHMLEVDRMSTDGTKCTVAIELWWIVFNEHEKCPPQCMGTAGVKCVLFLPDFETFLEEGPGGDTLTPLKMCEDCFMFKRRAVRPAIMEMSAGNFMVWNDLVGLSHTFRLNPFMMGHELIAMLVNRFGLQTRDWVLMVGEDELIENLSLLMQGIHEGHTQEAAPLSLMACHDYWSAALPTTPLSLPPW
jgi:hypothetical protein